MDSYFKFPQVRVVEASAGSGKTHALAKRYLQLLFFTASSLPQNHKQILAITFTNKAAFEMKTRIMAMLKNIALGKLSFPQAQDILKPLNLGSDQARIIALRLMQDLIRHYHFFSVLTIDSFMNTLLAGCAFKVNLSARFKIKRNAADHLQLSLDELIDEALERKDLKGLFEEFIRQYLFLENRSGWFPKKDLLATLSVLFDQYNTYQKPFLIFGERGKDIIGYKKQFIKLAQDLRELLPEATDKKFVGALDSFIARHESGFDIDSVSNYFSRDQVPVNKNAQVSDELDGLWQKSKRLLNGICLGEAYAVFDPYVNLFNAMMKHFTALQAKEDILFLQQLNKKAGDLFDDGLITLQELYFRLATRFRHYLIDEFQDTSLSQWHNLQAMIEEGLSSGGTFFYVGDKKQAIYSFRRDSLLFDQVQEGLAHYNLEHETLSVNYRSHKNIVEFNNHLFAVDHLMKFLGALEDQDRSIDKDIVFNAEDQERLRHIFEHAQQTHRSELPHGFVSCELISGLRSQQRDAQIRQKVLAIISNVRERFALGDIAVLTRNNAQALKVTQWLIQAGIFAQSERTSDIKNHPLIMELVYFLRFLHSPVDDAALAQFLLGDCFSKACPLPQPQVQSFLFSCRGRSGVPLYKQFSQRYPQIWQEYFEDFLDQAGVYPLYELLVGICSRLGCIALYPQAQGFIMHFLELAKRREEESCDLESFLEYFDQLEDESRFIPMPAQDAVHVLTVHKSKGLEFKAVIIPFLEMPIKAGTGDRNSGQSFILNADPEGLRLMRLKDSYTKFSEQLRQTYTKEYKASLFAELNNVYVALTRAIWEMYILIPERVGNSINPAPLLILPEMFAQGQVHKPAAKQQEPLNRQLLQPRASEQWIGKLREESLSQTSVEVKARLHGKVIHYCLARIKNLTGADVKAQIDAAIQNAAGFFLYTKEWGRTRAILEQMIGNLEWRKFFYLPPRTQVLCEQEVIDGFGNARRMDRLVIFPNEVWVVDFKSSRSSRDEHQRQIDEYQSLLKLLYPDKTIQGFLLYFDDHLQ